MGRGAARALRMRERAGEKESAAAILNPVKPAVVEARVCVQCVIAVLLRVNCEYGDGAEDRGREKT